MIQLFVCKWQLRGFIKSFFPFAAIGPETHADEGDHQKQGAETELQELRRLGHTICVDDFGTGYSSLNTLKRLPLSGIKIDESFVHAAPNSKDDLTIMQAITLAGQGFGLDVIAEGVETEWHQTLCKEVGCNTIQGNYESKPLTAEDFATQYLKKK